MKKTISTIAVAAILAASTALAPAFAQTSAPATSTPANPPASTAAPSDTTAAPMKGDAMKGSMAATATSGSESYLTQQSATQMSANSLIGKSITNGQNENIGDVNDLIFEQNGGLVAAVVGVGGFLGIGEKNVALPMSKLTISQDVANKGDVKITTAETADALKSAPEFKSLSDQTDATTTSSTTDMPAANSGANTPSTAPSK